MRHAGWKKLVAAGIAVLALAACDAPPAAVRPAASPKGAAPLPPNTQIPADVPSPLTAPPCVDRASYRPTGALPPPGAAPAGSTMAAIVQRGRLTVGIDQNAYLFGYRDPRTGQLVGFEIDIAKEVARALFGDPEAVQFVAITTADRIPVIVDRRVDMVVRTMTMTCERWKQVAFSTEYISSHQRLLVNRGSGIRSLDDLGGRRVCATRGSTSIALIAGRPSRPVPVSTDSTLDCLVLLQQGQVEAVSTIDILLFALAAQDPGTEIVGPEVSDEPSGIGMNAEAIDLVRFVNAVLERIRADGTWQRIYGRWLGRFGSVPSPPPAVYRD